MPKPRTRTKNQFILASQLEPISRGTFDSVDMLAIANACNRAVLAVMRSDFFVEKGGRIGERRTDEKVVMHGTVRFRVHHSEYGQSAAERLGGFLFILVANGGAKGVQKGVDGINTFKAVEF